MPIDLSNEKVRRNYHATVLRIMAKLERTVQRQLKPLINRQYMDSAKLIQQGILDVDYVVSGQRQRLRNVLKTHYRRTANVAGRQAVQAFDPSKSMGDGFWQEIDDYTNTVLARKVTQINKTTREVITSLIYHGINEGDSYKEIAKNIRKTGNIDSKFRSLRIARTETHGMYNSATEASVRDTGFRFKRIWSTTKDTRTRKRKKGSIYDHWSADKQERDQETPFDVSFEKLKFPGDISLGATAGNIINCRCVLLYEME